jgi:hypothetical protein
MVQEHPTTPEAACEKLVFVLGAGFTRAFVPNAPLLVDDYGIPRLRDRFASFSHAAAILADALATGSNDRIDLERLMTRLGGMPYDGADARRELTLLESELRKSLVTRLREAKAAEVDREHLGAFARFVLKNNASIVTFNYDDVLDQALWEVHRATSGIQPPEAYWHPDGGYGFFCRPSSICVADAMVFMDQPRSLLLKLHGSINWHSRLGEGSPRGPAALLHHEQWLPQWGRYQYEAGQIESHLEPDPFIVPPVLVKSELSLHPVLRVVWELAHDRLANATTVVFVGYSLPATDLASRILFRETLANRSGVNVRIVNIARDSAEEQSVKDTYRSLFNDLPDTQFEFSGASVCIEREFSQALVASGAEGTV